MNPSTCFETQGCYRVDLLFHIDSRHLNPNPPCLSHKIPLGHTLIISLLLKTFRILRTSHTKKISNSGHGSVIDSRSNYWFIYWWTILIGWLIDLKNPTMILGPVCPIVQVCSLRWRHRKKDIYVCANITRKMHACTYIDMWIFNIYH